MLDPELGWKYLWDIIVQCDGNYCLGSHYYTGCYYPGLWETQEGYNTDGEDEGGFPEQVIGELYPE